MIGAHGWRVRSYQQSLAEVALAVQSEGRRVQLATLRVFVSFEFDKDQKLKNDFIGQAKNNTQHRIVNSSLNEAYPTVEWRRKASDAIRECDVVVVVVGKDTHNASGVRIETDMARSFGVPVFQVVHDWQPHKGVPHFEQPIPWRWKSINAKLDEIAAR